MIIILEIIRNFNLNLIEEEDKIFLSNETFFLLIDHQKMQRFRGT